ncbi:hypothetical protein BC793_105283 [Actinoplanes xinjiangensis]|uniref:Uncharacterized protein n=1 Tax=Actinoplanes xinjiangensis TaxID=512350 RepID=A0A316FLF4_9ACTN|nr:hypothetical protein [Actinoplanes xinjiangensis]PWK48932.1 hypothetical protein BC793_105283 [Actinoplanes xinjiangensis]GIF38638.1 hypothetical protein Axi01nite_29490 [Actinoplanes xinjiangensis]
MLKNIRGVAVPLLALGFLPGCSGGDGSGTVDDTAQKLLKPPAVVEEYKAKAAAYPFPLPANYQFPATMPEPAENVLSEPGIGTVYADRYWQCAWMAEWLQNRKDTERAATAMNWLERFRESDFMRRYLEPPGPEQWTDSVLAEAKLGDPTKLRSMYGGCQEVAGMPPLA